MRLTIPGDPVSQDRMRLSRFRGQNRVYDPCWKEKKEIKDYLRAQFKDLEEPRKFEYPIVSFLFYMPIPKSTSMINKKMYGTELINHIKKPDVDNLAKLYLDCLDEIYFDGDQSVSLGHCVKIYSANPRTVVVIEAGNQYISPQAQALACHTTMQTPAISF